MSTAIARAYDRSPYPDFAFWATHPDNTGMLGRLFGLATAHPDACKVLEIGSAVGGNIIPMAQSMPTSYFVGVDLSGVQVGMAAKTAQDAGVENLTLIHGDFREVPERMGSFDYIICHGVFAWITPEEQKALLRFIGERLAPTGVAFVSYNTYPGHHMVDMVRKVFQVHTGHLKDIAARSEQGIAMLRFIQRQARRIEHDWRVPFLEMEIQAINDSGFSLLEHDYCAVESHPMYFGDFVALANEAGMAYLADSTPWNMYLDNHPPEIVETLKPLEDDVARAQYIDFVTNQRFRETLLCRTGALSERDVRAERVEGFHIGQALQTEPNLDGIRDSLPVQILVPRRPPMTVAHPIIRLALHRLYHCGRYSPSFDELAGWVEADLVTHDIRSVEQSSVRERLPAQLLRAFFAQSVRFGLRGLPIARTMPERPRTGDYQRIMARERRGGVTSLTHEVFENSPMMQALIPQLDGTRTLAELQPFWAESPIEESLAELLRRGYLFDPSAA